MSLLSEIQEQLNALPDDKRKEVLDRADKHAEGKLWIPNPGPQLEAYLSPADVLLYGGQGGGGKSDLGLGLAFTQFTRSLVMRRRYTELTGLTDRALQINGSRKGYSGSPPPSLRTADGRLIQFAANQLLGDEQSWQGNPFSYKYFDEACQFLELQIRFHLGWLRDASGGRTRAVLGTNPPVDADGDWIIGMFRPWLDLTHHHPAEHGELRWYVSVPDPQDPKKIMDIEIEERDLGNDEHGRHPVQRDGQTLYAKSRTFIPAALSDNPYLIRTNYQAELDALPEPIRSAVRDGNFMAARADAEFQVIPTQWVIEAQSRWTSDGWRDFAMTAMAVDPAGGGADAEEIVARHGPWFGQPITTQGDQTADGSTTAGRIIKHRRNNAPVVVDVGGGYGGAVCLRLRDNMIAHTPFNGANKTGQKTLDRTLSFVNKRAEAWWRFREALDPDQEGGSPIALPPDAELRSDLTAPTFTVTANGIKLEEKIKIRDRIGRSPGKGDATVMCWSAQEGVVRRLQAKSTGNRPSYSNVGYSNMKRGRR